MTRSGRLRAVGQLEPGQSTPIAVKGDERALALAVRGVPGAADGPHVTLTGPSGDKRVVTTSAIPGDYAFSGLSGLAPASLKPKNATTPTALVDNNPLSATTTILLPKPGKGTWTLKVDPGSGPVTGVDVATRLPDIPKDAVEAVVSKETSGKATIAVASATRGLARSIRVSQVPAYERGRLRTLRFKLRKGTGKVMFIDNGPKSSRIVGSPTASGAIAFDPAADPGRHTIRAVFHHPNGLPRASRVVAGYVAPGPPRPQRPRVEGTRRKGGAVEITLRALPPAPDAHAGVLRVRGKGAQGTRIDAVFAQDDLKPKKGGGWTLLVEGLPAKGGVDLSLTGTYGAKKSATAKVVL